MKTAIRAIIFALLTLIGVSAEAQFTYVQGSQTGVFVTGSSGVLGTSVSVPLHVNPPAGALILCGATWKSATASATVSDSQNGSYNPIGPQTPGTGGMSGYSAQMFYIPTAKNAATTVTMTVSASVVSRYLICGEYTYTGVLRIDGTPQYSNANAVGNLATISGVATTSNNDLLVAMCLGVGNACTQGAGFTLRNDTNALNFVPNTYGWNYLSISGQGNEDKTTTTIGPQSATFGTVTANDLMLLGLVAFSTVTPPQPPNPVPPSGLGTVIGPLTITCNTPGTYTTGPVSFTCNGTGTVKTVLLNWTATTTCTGPGGTTPCSPLGYNIKRGLVSGGPYVQIGTIGTTSYTDTTVVGQTTYYYVVTAYLPACTPGQTTPCGESPNSNQTTATMP